ncbi:MAG: DNA-processing protein DprA [Gammaproteobacteria bacterium]|nr:DNA-processing protein DprA [Gammaproteobacteria bacterium]
MNTVKDGASEHSQTYAWLVLLHAAAAAEHDLSQLLAGFGTAQAVLDAVGAGAINRSHLPGPVLKALREPDTQEIEREIRSLERPDYHLVPLDSPQYPAILKQTAAPPCLFVRGDPEVLGSCQVAIVGSRKPTMDGRRDARYFAGELARQGITVTSGLARGIDTEAHRGALGQQGRTVAVLGSGLDCIYPESNAGLADRISESGALVSEFPLSWRPLPHNFPRRNRVISGLSEAVLVVEAARRSGSLSTARHALEQNREVFAVPGSIRNPMKQGCHGLLREGAGLAERVEDIAGVLGRCVNLEATSSGGASAGVGKSNTLDEREKVLLDNIGYEPTGLDEIVDMTGLGIEDIMGKLLNLELEGLITAVAPGLYMRAEREPS